MTTTTISKGNFLRSFSPPYRGQTVVQFRSEITSWVDRPVVFHFVQDERFETNYKFQSILFYYVFILHRIETGPGQNSIEVEITSKVARNNSKRDNNRK